MPTIQINELSVNAETIAAHDSLLNVIRAQSGLSGTKEGCASGDCGACTVMLFDAGSNRPYTVNSCITPAGAAIDRQVITVEGVGTPGELHPVQRAMVDLHGSQCGFCTPGFVVSLAAKTQHTNALESFQRADAIEAISGNLCRCTGYRPIVDAAMTAAIECAAQPTPLNMSPRPQTNTPNVETPVYSRPNHLSDVLQHADHNGMVRTLTSDAAEVRSPWLIAGATDAFLEVTQRYCDPDSILDLSAVEELKRITITAQETTLGAAVTHAQALQHFSKPETRSDAIVDVLKRFGSPQIRSRGTLGGNIANASPIADWPPLLLALDAELTLTATSGQQRRLPLSQFYIGYKETNLAVNELITAIHIPQDESAADLYAHKISKRFEDDISSVLLALHLKITDAKVTECRLAMGGVAATPVRCERTEQRLLGSTLTSTAIQEALAELGNEITPISDVRATAEYRRAVSQSLLQQALQEHKERMSQGDS